LKAHLNQKVTRYILSLQQSLARSAEIEARYPEGNQNRASIDSRQHPRELAGSSPRCAQSGVFLETGVNAKDLP